MAGYTSSAGRKNRPCREDYIAMERGGDAVEDYQERDSDTRESEIINIITFNLVFKFGSSECGSTFTCGELNCDARACCSTDKQGWGILSNGMHHAATGNREPIRGYETGGGWSRIQ